MDGRDAFVFGYKEYLQNGKEDELKKLLDDAYEKQGVGKFDDECGKKFTAQLLAITKPEKTTVAKNLIEAFVFNMSF